MAVPLDPPTPGREATAATRDAGLFRVRRITRWLLTGAVALTSVFAALAAHATSSTTSGATGGDGSSGQTGSGTAQTYGDDGGYDDEGYEDDGYGSYGEDNGYSPTPQAAAQAPQASQSPPSASSGAS